MGISSSLSLNHKEIIKQELHFDNNYRHTNQKKGNNEKLVMYFYILQKRSTNEHFRKHLDLGIFFY